VQRWQVLISGCGPVGAVLAARLGALGVRTLVVERDPAPYPLPRAVAADDEVQQLLSRTAPGLLDGALADQHVRFLDARRRLLGEIAFPRSEHGFSGLAFFHQPTLEQRLRAHLATLPTVEVRLGVELAGFVQDDTSVRAWLADGSTVAADWLVGCDGASSGVRRGAGLGWRGRDLAARWLVADVVGTVPDRQRFTYTCDPARPQVDLPVPGGHRWEWLVRSGPATDGRSPGGAEGSPDPLQLIRRDTDAPVELVRAVTYRFGARRAEHWSAGRVLLAGDAAHTMPPFAGQGLGAGIRDAWSLAWRLAAGDPRGYEAERAPHVRQMTRLSLLLGATLQASHGAPARDALLRGAFAAPGLGPWLARGGPRSSVSGVLTSRSG